MTNEPESDALCHPHNIASEDSNERRFGIRISARASDPFARLVGDDWHTEYWYATASERDEKLADKARIHEYSRPHDAPTLVYEPIER